MTSGTKNKNK